MRQRGPTGFRSSFRVEPGLARTVAGSVAVREQLAVLVGRIAAEADRTCPVATPDELSGGREPGALKASQEHEVYLSAGRWTGIVAYTEFYAHMVHNGTVRQAPQPWLFNAVVSVLNGFTASLETAALAA